MEISQNFVAFSEYMNFNNTNNISGFLPIRNMLALFRIKHVANNKENINEKAVRPIQALI